MMMEALTLTRRLNFEATCRIEGAKHMHEQRVSISTRGRRFERFVCHHFFSIPAQKAERNRTRTQADVHFFLLVCGRRRFLGRTRRRKEEIVENYSTH